MNLRLAAAPGTKARGKRRRTVTSVVERALRELPARDDGVPEKDDLLPTYGAQGSHPLVDIDDRDALDAELGRRAFRVILPDVNVMICAFYETSTNTRHLRAG